MTTNKPYKLSGFFSILCNPDIETKYNLAVAEEIFRLRIAPIFLSKLSSSIYLFKKESSEVNGQIRYSDHWNYTSAAGFKRAKTDIETEDDTWYKGIYSSEKECYIITNSYGREFNNPTKGEIIKTIAPYRHRIAKELSVIMRQHDIAATDELNKRCKDKQIFYGDKNVKKIVPHVGYTGYIISLYGTVKKKIINGWENKGIIDSSGELIDLTPLMPNYMLANKQHD